MAPRDRTHPLVALTASLRGARTRAGTAELGRAEEGPPRRFPVLGHAVPGYSTFSRVFRTLDPQAFAAAFGEAAWIGAPEGVVAVDNKAPWRAHAAGRARMPPLSVSA